MEQGSWGRCWSAAQTGEATRQSAGLPQSPPDEPDWSSACDFEVDGADILAALDLTGVEAMQAEIKRLKEVLTEIAGMAPLEQPPPAYDDYGWQIADTPERHADRAVDIAVWNIATRARAAMKEADNG